MLSRTNRFHGHGAVRRVYRQGRPVRSGLFSMHVHSGEQVGASKVAVVVSRKVHKSAVKRNRIRRRIFALVRPRLATFKHPAELVITVYQPEIAEMPSEKLDAALTELFKKAHL